MQRSQWRRKRDSNPRASRPANGFQDRRFQPLTHSSAAGHLYYSGGVNPLLGLRVAGQGEVELGLDLVESGDELGVLLRFDGRELALDVERAAGLEHAALDLRQRIESLAVKDRHQLGVG